MLAEKETEQKKHVRWMIRRDMPFVIENDKSYSDRWSEDAYLSYLRKRNAIGMVVETDEVMGHMVYELHKHKIVLVRIAVHQDNKRCGCGTSMIRKLTGKLSPLKRSSIEVDVDEYNLVGQQFLRSCGFVAISVSGRYCIDGCIKFEYTA